jgi:hypothetical protein
MLNKQFVASVISRIFGPESVVPIIIWFLTNNFLAPSEQRLLLSIVSGVLFLALPMASFVLFFRLGKLTDIDVTNRHERPPILLLKQFWWTVGIVSLFFITDSGYYLTVYSWWYMVALSIFLISTFWKISLHSVGMVSLSLVFLRLFPSWSSAVFLVLLTMLVGWSRWYQRKHTLRQLIAGGLIPLIWWGATLTIR